MGHVTMPTSLLCCIDGRKTFAFLIKVMNDLGYKDGEYDHICMAGGPKRLASDSEVEYGPVLEELKTSYRLHSLPDGFVILMHDDCGAYGIAEREAERTRQEADLVKITKRIQETFPGIRVRGGIITGTDTGNLKVEIKELSS